ncbi:MAG: RNA-binding transcriptional accessory protein [Paludibacteraceae bacterium]|nr:RNA-binding transcriptional accessory protein [Paludibacteraceae bacterium]
MLNIISNNLNISLRQVENTIKLLSEGATIPFISRYRKEMTGNLDEMQIAAIQNQHTKLCELAKRKETILTTIEEQGKLTDELRSQIEQCYDAIALEDIYLPFKPKRRTRAEIAKEKGLEPLAKMLMKQNDLDVCSVANRFVSNEIESEDDALKGARDIMAEWISESTNARNAVRNIFSREAIISSKVIKGKEEEGNKYRDYFDLSEPLRRCSSHRYLAMRRGESEGFLKVSISPEDDHCIERLNRIFVRTDNDCSKQVNLSVADAYKRLIKPSIENEFAGIQKEKSDTEAIRVFAENAQQLLLAPPLGQKRVMGIDPGYRTGCKVVCLDNQGNLLHNETIYPHPPKNEKSLATRKIQKLVEQYKIEAIAIGNGTASRETEHFIQNIRYDRELKVFVVSENGASIYSASKVAREEFPDYDVTVRGAVSIARRLMDPLAELVKIDPKSIGVGQYQHDVDQSRLKQTLDQTVESCVNRVGVELNTASKHLLVYVSGLGPQLAQNIVDYRTENGAFSSRNELLNVAKMGKKSFEQCAGFLRINGAENPLDNSAVHPESYHVVERMAKDCQVSVKELIENKTLREQIDLNQYVSEKIGLPTLTDIMKELDKPGRDPRKGIKVFMFDPTISKIEDLKEGQILPGLVTNITNFGVFVDVGIKENGLVHISQLADKFINDPTQIVRIGQEVNVKVLEVDLTRKRVALTMRIS